MRLIKMTRCHLRNRGSFSRSLMRPLRKPGRVFCLLTSCTRGVFSDAAAASRGRQRTKGGRRWLPLAPSIKSINQLIINRSINQSNDRPESLVFHVFIVRVERRKALNQPESVPRHAPQAPPSSCSLVQWPPSSWEIDEFAAAVGGGVM